MITSSDPNCFYGNAPWLNFYPSTRFSLPPLPSSASGTSSVMSAMLTVEVQYHLALILPRSSSKSTLEPFSTPPLQHLPSFDHAQIPRSWTWRDPLLPLPNNRSDGLVHTGEIIAQSSESTVLSLLMSRTPALPLAHIKSLLQGPQLPDELASSLLDIIGFDDGGWELVEMLVKERVQIGRLISDEAYSKPASNQPIDPDFLLAQSLRQNAQRNLPLAAASSAQEVYPHVYQAAKHSGLAGMSYGGRFALPMGTMRFDYDLHEEVTVPPSRPIPPKTNEKLIPLTEMDNLCRGSFPGYTSLNRVQSIIFPTAYGTNENMLVCAPTGAGKTEVATLSILRVLSQNLLPNLPNSVVPRIARDDFKIIYVAPMKALAAEIVRKLGKRLGWLKINVRELTGDMQLTKAEIAETQIIVTTPEKWDVVTRKPTGEGELASKVKLLIIDEVHLLNEERGAVIETIVARTLRQVESSQSLIRIVGLSATLPNYVDVGDFLRPVPLEQHFLGIRGKNNSPQQKKNLDEVVFEKVSEMVSRGHQVMVFVHARKETVKSGMTLHDQIMKEGTAADYDCSDNPVWEKFKRDIGTSKNKEMRELFGYGIGIHHAGMLRTDRNMVERMFESGCLKVLFCTSTLAWGVNLPAHAVVIKGTQVYDSGVGKFVNLSILDVLQIFGRAGRPGFETSGVGYICTPQDQLDHYLDAILSQHPIESQFVAGMIDSMNAEIALGTITDVGEAVQWMGYTYLFVRMKRNPFNYGMPHDVTADDPQLGNKRHQLVQLAAKKLVEAKMIEFDETSGKMSVTDLGRIAAKYYIRVASIEIFNENFKPRQTEADVLSMLAMSTEFDQIQVRENEIPELKFMMDEIIPCQVKGGTDTSQGKVNILLQGHISQVFVEDFALVSDTAFVAQNAGRIIRALLEIAISRRWAATGVVLLSLSKAVEKRMWPYDHPMSQFNLHRDVLYNLQQHADDTPVTDLAASNAEDLGNLIRLNKIHGAALLTAARQFPTLDISFSLRPMSHDLLSISIDLSKRFQWNERLHRTAEPFWVWVEDHEGVNILQVSNVLIRSATSSVHLDFIIPIRSTARPPFVTIRAISDRWMGVEDSVTIPFDHLVMPKPSTAHTSLLDLPYLPLKCLENPQLQAIYSKQFQVLNGIQTQCFWPMYHTQESVLVCAPSASGKTTLGEFAVWNALRSDHPCRILIVAARRDDARNHASRLRGTFSQSMKLDINLLLRSSDFLSRPSTQSFIGVTHPGALLSFYANASPDDFGRSLSLLLLDDLHLMDEQYELAISRMLVSTRAARVRTIGLSASLNDPLDIGSWLGVDPSFILSFRPKDRGTAFSTTVQTFTLPHSAVLLKAMTKPAFDVVHSYPGEPTILFVTSRAQCLTVARDLVTQSGAQMDLNGFLGTSPEGLEPYLRRLKDRASADILIRGIGIFHSGLAPSDQALVLELFALRIIQVLVVPREACWTLPVRSSIVVVMGTQYLQIKSGFDASSSSSAGGADRQVARYTNQELVKMQSFAVQPPTTTTSISTTGKFVLLCQAEHRDSYLRFLTEGLPLESLLHLPSSNVLRSAFQAEMAKGTIKTKQDGLDFLTHTFLIHRIRSNPTFYGAMTSDEEDEYERLSRVVDRCMDEENIETEEKVESKVLEKVKENAIRVVPGSAPKV
ncbi:sec63-domain-containing protein [Phaffia rhodozyma]|uniref:Sec63-domain-containing protein n=1 Tax=Phaffia rhodozyma TaxID=264483 RepID=A0A0F7SMR1_PHARH|nr:sec63-domain-containing protein [Phaffia rhodozyma]